MTKENNNENEMHKATENWLLALGWLGMDCRKCDLRREGCYKDCKFVKAYKERIKK